MKSRNVGKIFKDYVDAVWFIDIPGELLVHLCQNTRQDAAAGHDHSL